MFRKDVLKLYFKEGVAMLKEAEVEQGYLKKLSIETEKVLG